MKPECICQDRLGTSIGNVEQGRFRRHCLPAQQPSAPPQARSSSGNAGGGGSGSSSGAGDGDAAAAGSVDGSAVCRWEELLEGSSCDVMHEPLSDKHLQTATHGDWQEPRCVSVCLLRYAVLGCVVLRCAMLRCSGLCRAVLWHAVLCCPSHAFVLGYCCVFFFFIIIIIIIITTMLHAGPSYPQGIALGPADVSGTALKAGLYVVATNNKEDVWLAHIELQDLHL